jgi:hypothetical protein
MIEIFYLKNRKLWIVYLVTKVTFFCAFLDREVDRDLDRDLDDRLAYLGLGEADLDRDLDRPLAETCF